MNNKELKYKKGFIEYLKREEASEREILLGDIMNTMQTENLLKVNDFLDLKIDNPDNELLEMIEKIGLIKVGIEKDNKIKFVDKFDIAKYFPGYLRQEKYWNSIRE